MKYTRTRILDASPAEAAKLPPGALLAALAAMVGFFLFSAAIGAGFTILMGW